MVEKNIKLELSSNALGIIIGIIWGILISIYFGVWLIANGYMDEVGISFYFIIAVILTLTSFLVQIIYNQLSLHFPTGISLYSLIISLSSPLILLSLSPLALYLNHYYLVQFLGIAAVSMLLVELWLTFNFHEKTEKVESKLVVYIFSGIFVFCLLILFQNNIVHDAFQYYGYLRSMVIDGDLNIFNEFFHYNSERFYNPYPHYSGRYLGTSLAFLPFFLAGHLIALLSTLLLGSNGFLPDGYSMPYTLFVSFGSSLYGLLAVLLTYRLLRKYFSVTSSLFASLSVWLGTALLFFMFQWNAWAHTPSAFTTALFLNYARRSDSKRSFFDWFPIGLLLGFMFLLRPLNVLFGFILIWDGVIDLKGHHTNFISRFSLLLKEALLVLSGMFIVLSFQLNFWKEVSGHFFMQPYKEVGDYFTWLSPKIIPLLFSAPRHGLFLWTPLTMLGIIGLFWFRSKDKFPYITIFFLQVYFYACWSIWWTGVGFSNRFFVNCLPLFALGIGALLEHFNRRFGLRVILTGIIFIVYTNINFISAYRTDRVPMGIASPQRVVNNALTTFDLYKKVLLQMPSHIDTLFENFWINENFFIFRLSNAISNAIFSRIFLLFATLLLFSFIAYYLTKSILGTKLSMFRLNSKQIAVFSIIFILLLNIIIYIEGKNYQSVENIHRIPGDFFTITSPNERELFVNYREKVNNLDIISYLIYSGSIKQGTVIATISVTDWSNNVYTMPLHVGVETAECSVNRPEYKKDLAHSIDKTKIRHRFTLKAYSRYIYTGYGYLSTIHLTKTIVVKKVLVSFVYDRGTLVVTDLILSRRNK